MKTVPDRWEEGGAGSQAMFDPYLEPRPARAPVRLSNGNLMWRPGEIGLAVLAVAYIIPIANIGCLLITYKHIRSTLI